MRKVSLFLIALVVLFAAGSSAQFLGQMSPASTLDKGTGKLGGFFVTSENHFAVAGSMRYGFSEFVEGRFRMGLIDAEGPHTDPHLVVGIDFKSLLWQYKQQQNPFDLSVGAGIEYGDFERSSVLGIGGSVIGSMPFQLRNGSTLEPYARINLRYQRTAMDDYYDHDRKIEGDSDSELKAGVNMGVLFAVTRGVDFIAEFQIDEEIAFFFGIDFLVF